MAYFRYKGKTKLVDYIGEWANIPGDLFLVCCPECNCLNIEKDASSNSGKLTLINNFKCNKCGLTLVIKNGEANLE